MNQHKPNKIKIIKYSNKLKVNNKQHQTKYTKGCFKKYQNNNISLIRINPIILIYRTNIIQSNKETNNNLNKSNIRHHQNNKENISLIKFII